MSAKRITKVILLVAAVLMLIVFGVLAWIFTPGLREPVAVSSHSPGAF